MTMTIALDLTLPPSLGVTDLLDFIPRMFMLLQTALAYRKEDFLFVVSLSMDCQLSVRALKLS